jgi:uncharacterized SAM-binding protein YcdF (DUF218 family)
MNIDIAFMLKKIISIILMPISIGIILGLIALLFLYLNKSKKAKNSLSLALLWIIFITWAPLGNFMLEPLESQYPKLTIIPKNIDYILLLGGDREHRTWEALRLYHQIPNVKIITSGYSLHDTLSDAEKTTQLLYESGIPKVNILMQKEAKTTFEEAQYLKQRVGKKPFILITSAYHMPRSMLIFKKAGLNPIPAPTDFNDKNESGFFSMLTSKYLKNTEHAWHEYMGLLVYKLQGKI